MKKKLAKILIDNKICSRRSVKSFLRNNKILINNTRTQNENELVDIQTNADSSNFKHCKIFINNSAFFPKSYTYILMNKPSGVVCKTVSDKNKTVYSLFDSKSLYFNPLNLHTVGRLDLDTEGLLILTDDGDFSHKLTSPESKCPKTYFVELKKTCNKNEQERIKNVFSAPFALPAEKKSQASVCNGGQISWISEKNCMVTISEGQFHQIKRMFLAVENEVSFLKRTKIGRLELPKDLQSGSWRFLTKEELELF